MPKMITNEDASYAFEIVKKICDEVGPGFPGSSQERERAAMIARELESHLGAENVSVEEFTLAPLGALSVYPISALLTRAAALLNISTGRIMGISPWVNAVAALAFSTIALLVVVFEFVLGHELVDPLLRKEKSVNMVGRLRRPGTKDVKRILILGGHHDSAWENTWFGLLGNLKRSIIPKSQHGSDRENRWLLFLGYIFLIFSAAWFLGFVFMIAASAIQLAGLIAGNAGVVSFGTLGWGLLAFPILPSVIYGWFFNRGKKNGGTVPGAADNLSASALAVAMCRFLVQHPDYIPPDTEIRFISFGSEEAGLRGSRRYVARHLEELKRLHARLLNYETVAHPEIVILSSDLNGTLMISPEMVKSAVAAAERAGVPYKVAPAFFGNGSDVTPFVQAGVKAVTLFPFQMPQQMIDFYHQKWDNPDILTIDPLLNVLKLTLEWVRSCGE